MSLVHIAPTTTPEPYPEETRALRWLSVHEASHALVAELFGLRPVVFIAGPGRGACFHCTGTPRQNAAISWAGIVGEDLSGCRNPARSTPPVAPSWPDLGRYASSLAVGDVSSQDLQGIAQYPRRADAAALAYKTLSARLTELESLAAFVAAHFREPFVWACRVGEPWEAELEVGEFVRALREFDHREAGVGGAAGQPSLSFKRYAPWIAQFRDFLAANRRQT